MSVSLKNIGWAAGFYEGERSFVKPGVVSICQKDPEPLYKIWNLFGGAPPEKYGNYYYWRIYGVEARQFLLTIFSFLSRRRKKQILEQKEFFNIPDRCPNGHEYGPNPKIYIDNSKGRSYRVCKLCQMNNSFRKRKNRKVEN